MSKTPILQTLPCWEYLYFTRKSEQALWTELNVVGGDGWELVNTHIYKDAKGVPTWIAFLKRRASGGGSGQSHATTEAAPAAERPAGKEPHGFDLSGEVFDFKKE